VNSLLAVEQDTKVRPCLNVSLPKDCSFNDNVDECKVEKVYMTSARSFGHAIVDCGKGANMSKFDMCDAYKLMPAKPEDYRLQGLSWLNKFFVETQQIFGLPRGEARTARISCHSHQPNKLAKERGEGGVNRGLT